MKAYSVKMFPPGKTSSVNVTKGDDLNGLFGKVKLFFWIQAFELIRNTIGIVKLNVTVHIK